MKIINKKSKNKCLRCGRITEDKNQYCKICLEKFKIIKDL
jgi:RNA polymerase subunit RPABC4/transcription elongation factor Spt4